MACGGQTVTLLFHHDFCEIFAARMKPPTEKQSGILWFALTGLAMAAVVALVAAAFWGLGRLLNLLSPVLWPLAIAAVVACLLSPLVDWIEKRKLPRVRAIVLVFIAAFAVLGAVLASVVPQVVVETQDLVDKIPGYADTLQSRVSQFMAHPPDLLRHFFHKPADNPTGAPPENDAFASATTWLENSLPKMGSWLLGQLGKIASGFGLLAGLALVPVYAFYFLLEKRGIEKHWTEYLPVRESSAKNEIVFILESINGYMVAFFRGQVLVAICGAVLYTIGFSLIGVNYAFLLGFAAVFLTMIPFLGAIVICGSALVLAFVQFGDWTHPLLVLGVFAVVQTLESLVISPKIIGNRVGLHPVVIIIAVMTGTTLLGGLLGGILAIPLAAALRVILLRYVWKERET
jgi:predicted PurR-regulated permease PerM